MLQSSNNGMWLRESLQQNKQMICSVHRSFCLRGRGGTQKQEQDAENRKGNRKSNKLKPNPVSTISITVLVIYWNDKESVI